MSASNEYFEYHLTPGGWVDGSQKIDFQGRTERPTPTDTLLTVCFREFMASAYSGLQLTADVKEIGERDQIDDALKAHGVEPYGNASFSFRDWATYVKANGFEVPGK